MFFGSTIAMKNSFPEDSLRILI